MRKRLGLMIGLMIALALSGTAQAQGPTDRQSADLSWSASYWNNKFLLGPPVLQRQESAIDYDWGDGSPAPGTVKADEFSAHWERYIAVAPGAYWFSATSDDGMRLSIDGDLVINEWYNHAAKTVAVERYLDAGHHLVRVDYYENRGGAVAKVLWAPVPQETGDWQGEYFNNMTLSGTPATVRDEFAIDYNWGTDSPAPGIVGTNGFSVRWTRTLELDVGMYRFTLTADDGARLWVNGYLLIDAWHDQPPTTYTDDMYLPGGSTTMVVHYYENAGGATARLSWLPLDDIPTPFPAKEVIVDDLDAGFVQGGPTAEWHEASTGYGEHLMWTTSNEDERRDYNWARWYPELAGSYYEVSVHIPFRYTTTARARYQISHADGVSERIVDQSENGPHWVSLGTYRFRGTDQDYVSLSDVTGEPDRRLVAFDAVKWAPR